MHLNSYQDISEEEGENIHVRSDEVKEIMGHIPNRLVRYGIATIAFFVLCLIALSFFIKYPDLITCSFYIQSSNPPAFLFAKNSGKLQELLVADGDSVETGDLLAIFENPADSEGYRF